MKIPIQNIYYLLSYAWNRLDEAKRVAVSVDDKTELLDLFARVLINSSKILIKRGISKNYIPVEEEVNGIKGRLLIDRTFKSNILVNKKAICSFDDFSPNILLNQIVVSTLRNLLSFSDLAKENQKEIARLLFMLPGIITPIKVQAAHFKRLRLQRNNAFYDFVIKVCQLIFENTLPSEEAGKYHFSDFTRDKRKLACLFEDFVFQFYKREQKRYKVRKGEIEWKLRPLGDESKSHLPIMKTDITLESDTDKLIIDTKFYGDTVSSSDRFETNNEKLHSNNLYQIFSYLINQEDGSQKCDSTRGMLLYPTVSKEYDLAYIFNNHKIEIKTVDLAQDWRGIEGRLQDML